MGFVKEFKVFIMKGNILELAIALVMGAAFGKIITSLVDNILMPFIGSFLGSSFEALKTRINGVEIKYGLFIQAAVDFIIIAFVVFLVIKTMNRFKKKAEVIAEISSTDKLLIEIRDSLAGRDPNLIRER